MERLALGGIRWANRRAGQVPARPRHGVAWRADSCYIKDGKYSTRAGNAASRAITAMSEPIHGNAAL